jgi:hypothetical protein
MIIPSIGTSHEPRHGDRAPHGLAVRCTAYAPHVNPHRKNLPRKRGATRRILRFGVRRARILGDPIDTRLSENPIQPFEKLRRYPQVMGGDQQPSPMLPPAASQTHNRTSNQVAITYDEQRADQRKRHQWQNESGFMLTASHRNEEHREVWA